MHGSPSDDRNVIVPHFGVADAGKERGGFVPKIHKVSTLIHRFCLVSVRRVMSTVF